MGKQVSDLLGHASGFLTVVAFHGLYKYAGQNSGHWVCHCSRCDGYSVLPRKRLVSIRDDVRYDRCQACRVGKCIVCHRVIGSGNVGQLTCSTECLRLHDNFRSKLHHSKKAALNKHYHSTRWERHKELNPDRFQKTRI
jgi:hypothetical protein